MDWIMSWLMSIEIISTESDTLQIPRSVRQYISLLTTTADSLPISLADESIFSTVKSG